MMLFTYHTLNIHLLHLKATFQGLLLCD